MNLKFITSAEFISHTQSKFTLYFPTTELLIMPVLESDVETHPQPEQVKLAINCRDIVHDDIYIRHFHYCVDTYLAGMFHTHLTLHSLGICSLHIVYTLGCCINCYYMYQQNTFGIESNSIVQQIQERS